MGPRSNSSIAGKTVSVDLSLAGQQPPTWRSVDPPLPVPEGVAAQSAEGALVELHRAEDEVEKFFDETFARLQSLTLELVQRQQGSQAGVRLPADELRGVADCRRQFRVCLEELQEVQADARDAREETRRVWADVRAAQEQALRQYTQLGEAHAALLEELGRVRSLLETVSPAQEGKRGQSPFVRSPLRAVPANGDCPLFPPVQDNQSGANTAGGGRPPPISERAAAGEVLAPWAPPRPGNAKLETRKPESETISNHRT
jgi:hypothetical protein